MIEIIYAMLMSIVILVVFGFIFWFVFEYCDSSYNNLGK